MTSRVHGRRTDRQQHRKQPWLTDFVYVVSLKRFIDKKTGQMFDKEQFTDLFGYLGKDDVTAADHFLHYGGGRKVRRVTFRPGRPRIVTEGGDFAFNVYRPPALEPTPGSVKPW